MINLVNALEDNPFLCKYPLGVGDTVRGIKRNAIALRFRRKHTTFDSLVSLKFTFKAAELVRAHGSEDIVTVRAWNKIRLHVTIHHCASNQRRRMSESRHALAQAV